jgi:hypothetical protein
MVASDDGFFEALLAGVGKEEVGIGAFSPEQVAAGNERLKKLFDVARERDAVIRFGTAVDAWANRPISGKRKKGKVVPDYHPALSKVKAYMDSYARANYVRFEVFRAGRGKAMRIIPIQAASPKAGHLPL